VYRWGFVLGILLLCAGKKTAYAAGIEEFDYIREEEAEEPELGNFMDLIWSDYRKGGDSSGKAGPGLGSQDGTKQVTDFANKIGPFYGIDNLGDHVRGLATGRENITEFLREVFFNEVTDSIIPDAFGDFLGGFGGIGEALSEAFGMGMDLSEIGDYLSNLEDLQLGLANEDTPADGVALREPYLYIYVDAGEELTLRFTRPELLTDARPAYSGGYRIQAEPGGGLTVNGIAGCEYVYYECQTAARSFQREEGFPVEYERREETLRRILEGYGFLEKEIDDFVRAWEGELEEKNYVMYPQLTKFADTVMPLEIDGISFDSYSRLWFVFAEADTAEEYRIPDFEPVSHEGRALVEWGGCILLPGAL
jgi:hypothetical protein